MPTYPPPTGDCLLPAQRPALAQMLAFLDGAQYDQAQIDPHLPDLIAQMGAACGTTEEQSAMSSELDRWVRWYRLPGRWLAFIYQHAMRQAGSLFFVLGCRLYADAQICANSDLLVSSLENGYNALASWLVQADSPEVRRAQDDLRGRMRTVYGFYRQWYTPGTYRDINQLTEHLYGEKARRDLVAVFPVLDKPPPTVTPDEYQAVIDQCDAAEEAFCRVVARRQMGSVLQGRGEIAAAAEQFRLGLEEAQALRLDTEIGHLLRLHGYALCQLGRLEEGAKHFERAVEFESAPEYRFWQALSARELGDARLKRLPQPLDLDHPPPLLALARRAYSGGRALFDRELGTGVVPVARAVGQQMFRSYSDNALEMAAASRSPQDGLAEWEASGPRYATDVVAESRAALALSPEEQARFRQARAVFHQELGAFRQGGTTGDGFAAYLQSVGADRAVRRSYLESRLKLTTPVRRAQMSDDIAQQILALRLPQVVFLLLRVGEQKTTATLLDMGAGQMASASIPMGEADWAPAHDAYGEALRRTRGASFPEQTMRPALNALLAFYGETFGPLLEQFLPWLRGRHLKIFPRLRFNEVPWHALPVAGAPLAEHCSAVSYAQTLGLFLQLHRSEPDVAAPGALSVVLDGKGAPLYQGALRVLRPLYGEALDVLEDTVWPQARDGLAARPPSDLLFACHGEYDPDDPAASRLRLGGAEWVPFSRLFADLDLSGCRSVTLGACESGLGRTFVTAEYLGLPLAFFAAGARYVIGSLWKVNQLAASILLTCFYQRLQQGAATVPVLLNQAQADLRAMSRADVLSWVGANLPEKAAAWAGVVQGWDDPPFAHPYFWAGFYAAGDV